jgi:hypothetical protein
MDVRPQKATGPSSDTPRDVYECHAECADNAERAECADNAECAECADNAECADSAGR